jgi:hypothetical protein
MKTDEIKEWIDKLKEIETLVDLSINTKMTDSKAADIYQITNELMVKVSSKKKKNLYHYCPYCLSKTIHINNICQEHK